MNVPADLMLIGDYNLQALDYLPKCGLEWVGNCNELNAGTIEWRREQQLLSAAFKTTMTNTMIRQATPLTAMPVSRALQQ